mmetsp:Transcript_26419/g.81292  ORF Transcript_26419/g.81292 Transcript_26419/m.81292 type:complete len:298 (+) Transcript_26419:226-1119(+)
MIYDPSSSAFFKYLSADCKKLRIDKQGFACMQEEYNGLAQNPNDAAADRYLKICHRSIARCGQHIAGVIQSAASQKMFMYTVGNASDGGAEFLARGVHVSKARSVGRMMNMLRRRRLEGHPVFAGQRAGSDDGSETYSIEEPSDINKIRRDLTCLATRYHGHSRYPILELVATGSQHEIMARALMDMGLEDTPEAAAKKVSEMEMPFGNAKDGYKTTAANTVDPKQLAKRLKKSGQESGRSCSFCEKSDVALAKKLSRCEKCESAWYCSRDCQVSHWPAHKLICKNIAKQKKKASKT